MILSLSDNIIQKRFNRASGSYDKCCAFHSVAADGIIKKIDRRNNYGRILEVGHGTGLLTEKLSKIIRSQNIYAIDFSDGMAKILRDKKINCNIIQADCQKLPFEDSYFDLIVSNFTYQWVPNLSVAFKEANRVLKKNGQVIINMFGRNTFKELFYALTQVGMANEFILRLRTYEEIKTIINKEDFGKVNICVEEKKVYYPSAQEMLRWIKNIGANGLKRDFYFGRQLWQKFCERYEALYHEEAGIYATFEVISIEAKK